MSASLGLFRLQVVDRQIDQAQARLAIIHQTLENDAELRETLKQVQTADETSQQTERNLRETEDGVKKQQIKIEQAESSLYSGGVRNPKELQELQNDIASLKRHLSTLEERQLEAMLNAETAQTALQTARATLDKNQARRNDENRQLIEEQNSLSKTIERLKDERLAVVSDSNEHSLEMYETLRQQKRGLAVVEISDNTCAACGAPLTAALQQTARSMQVAYCPSCGRILYAG